MGENGVLVFPDAAAGRAASSIDPNLLLALQNNGGFGNNGNWIWILFLWMMWGGYCNGFGGFGGNNGTGFLANQLNNDAGRDLLLQAINGRADALSQLAQLTHGNVDQVRNAIGQLQLGISQVGSQVGMSGLETINALQLGNAALSRQLCECCCENRLATCQQTNTLQSAIDNHDANVRLQLAQLNGEDKLAICQQTNQLGSQADRNTNSILGAIANQNAMLEERFCEIKEREMQSKIDTQADIITQMRGQISNDNQSKEFNAAFNALNEKINIIAAKQPNTVPVQYPNLVAANATPYVGGYGCPFGFNYPQNNFWG